MGYVVQVGPLSLALGGSIDARDKGDPPPDDDDDLFEMQTDTLFEGDSESLVRPETPLDGGAGTGTMLALGLGLANDVARASAGRGNRLIRRQLKRRNGTASAQSPS